MPHQVGAGEAGGKPQGAPVGGSALVPRLVNAGCLAPCLEAGGVCRLWQARAQGPCHSWSQTRRPVSASLWVDEAASELAGSPTCPLVRCSRHSPLGSVPWEPVTHQGRQERWCQAAATWNTCGRYSSPRCHRRLRAEQVAPGPEPRASLLLNHSTSGPSVLCQDPAVCATSQGPL